MNLKTGVRLFAKNGKHYYKKGRSKELYPSVTGVIDAVLAKPHLVNWAKKVSIERFSYGLLQDPYAWGDVELVEEWEDYVQRHAELAHKEPDRVRDAAADLGTRAHDVIHCILANKPYKLTEDIRPSVDAFLKWHDETEIAIRYSEIRVASESLKVGGTIDLVGQRKGGDYVVIDLKTSKGIYDNFGYQVGGYARCFEEITGNKVAELWILRLPKFLGEGKPFEYKQVKDVSHAVNGFAAIKQVYDCLQQKMYV